MRDDAPTAARPAEPPTPPAAGASTGGPFAAWVAAGIGPAGPPGYELRDEVGRGGMGVVYRARDTSVGRDVAVKLLQDRYPATGPAARRFLDEARITGQLQHPGIPAVHQVGTLADGRPFLAMKLIKGRTLASVLADGGDRGPLVAVFEAVCQAVGSAHAHGVIHRDLKPANVMVGAFGEVQVMDWGLAKVLAVGRDAGAAEPSADPAATLPSTEIQVMRDDSDQTQDGQALGTPAFMPPEQAIGAVAEMDRRSDVFGLGAVLCAVLTGKPPYLGSDAASTRALAARAELDAAHTRLEACEADPDLVALCKRCLSPDRAARPADAGVVAAEVAALRAAADDRARAAEVEAGQVLVRQAEGRKRRRLLAGAGLAGLVLSVCALLGLLVSALARAEAASGRADAATARADLEAERRTQAEERGTRLGERYGLLLRLGAAQGDSREVLGLFEQAKADGLPITPEMRLDYIRGLAGAAEVETVRREVDAVPLDGLSPTARGRYELWRATTRFGADDAAAEEYLRVALTRPLPPAEREYAEGLRAATTPAAVERFKAAIRHDRLYQPARSDACLLLVTLGRLDEAVALADESARTHPRHPDFPVVLALAHTLTGDERKAQEALGPLDGLLPEAELRTLRALPPLVATALRLFRSRTGLGPKVENEFLAQAQVMWDASRLTLGNGGAFQRDTVGTLLGHLPPAQRDRLSMYAGLFGLQRPSATSNNPDGLSRAAGQHPECVLLVLAALAHHERSGERGRTLDERVRDLRVAAGTMERAAETPAVFPARGPALDLAVLYYTQLGLSREVGPRADPAALRHAAALLRRRLAVHGPVPPDRCEPMVRVALFAGDLTLAREVLDGWKRQAPADLDAVRLRVGLECRAEAYPAAVRAADRVLARRPFDVFLQLARLVVRAQLWRAAQPDLPR